MVLALFHRTAFLCGALALAGCANFTAGTSAFPAVSRALSPSQKFSVGPAVVADKHQEPVTSPSADETAAARETQEAVRRRLAEEGLLAPAGDIAAAEIRLAVCYASGGLLAVHNCAPMPVFNFPAAPSDYAASSTIWLNGKLVSQESPPHYDIGSVATTPETFAESYAKDLVDGIEQNLLGRQPKPPIIDRE